MRNVVEHGRKNTKQEALESANKNKIFFPTDDDCIIMGGKAYGDQTKIREDLVAETARAKAAEKTNADNIAAETARAKAAEEANADNIADLGSKVGDFHGVSLSDKYKVAEVDNDGKVLSGIDFNDVKHNYLDTEYHGRLKSKELDKINETLYESAFSEENAIALTDSEGKIIQSFNKNGKVSFPMGIDLHTNGGNYILIAASDSSSIDKSMADFVCDGQNDEAEINMAIEKLVNGGTIKLFDGNYFIDSFVHNGNSAIYFGVPQRTDGKSTSRTINIEGTTENKAYLSHYGVAIHVRQDLIDGLDNNESYRVFYGTSAIDTGQPSGFAWMTSCNNVNFKNFYLYLGNASKKLIGLDCSHFGSTFIEQVGVYTETYFTDRFCHIKPPTPAVGCIGVISNPTSNDEMARIGWDTLNCGGLYIGAYIDGIDHLVMKTCSMCRCCYGYYFANGTEKTMTMLNCCDEGNVHLPYFGGAGHITAIDFNVERFNKAYYVTDPTGNDEFYAVEETPNSWIGTIEYTLQGWSGADTGASGQHFWKDECGRGIRTRNLNPDHTGHSVPNCAEYLERYFDTNNNVWKTWNGSTWI